MRCIRSCRPLWVGLPGDSFECDSEPNALHTESLNPSRPELADGTPLSVQILSGITNLLIAEFVDFIH